MKFTNQNIVIIGGSTGIGFATAKLAKAQGANITLFGRSVEKLNQAAAALGGARVVAGNIGVEADIKRAFEGLESVSHVVVTAGTLIAGNVLQISDENIQRAIDERIWGNLYVVRNAVPRMSQGSITLISGMLADRPKPGTALTTVGCIAAEALTRSLAVEAAPIRFNAVSPGWTDTPLLAGVLGANKDAVVTQVTSGIPAKRAGTAEELAEAILFLMANDYMTGEVLHVDGGARLV